jgi:hypothetical protein
MSCHPPIQAECSATVKRKAPAALEERLVLGQRVCDALLDRFVLRPQRHFIVLGVLFHFCTAGRSRLLHGRFVGVLLRIGECRTQKKSARDDRREYPRHQ